MLDQEPKISYLFCSALTGKPCYEFQDSWSYVMYRGIGSLSEEIEREEMLHVEGFTIKKWDSLKDRVLFEGLEYIYPQVNWENLLDSLEGGGVA